MNDMTLSATQPEAAQGTETIFVCDCNEQGRFACQGEPFFRAHEEKRYCVLHYPGQDKLDAFKTALKRKLDAKDFDFQGVHFPERISFASLEFDANTYFADATFSRDVEFADATFGTDVYFSGTIFSADVNFSGATFSGDVYFSDAIFSADANFSRATFSGNAYFYATAFSAKTSFVSATFKNYVNFAGRAKQTSFSKQAWLNFQFPHIEKPDRVCFHTLDLQPHWFINCDCRKFEFADCNWTHFLKQELKDAAKLKVSAPHRLLAITCRQLADNAEANHRYTEASSFRYSAFEARRIEKFGGFVPWRLDWWYWLASGYGERVARAFVVFVALFALFAFGYGSSGFDQSSKGTLASNTQTAIQSDTIGKPLDLRDAFIYSFYVIILQKPEPKPLTRTAKILVGLETVLGPAQAALLALAGRRRFMR